MNYIIIQQDEEGTVIIIQQEDPEVGTMRLDSTKQNITDIL